ncbi:MAG TPA: TIGR02147 family protein [Myxococcota bacterium]|nr:TIGR02147 family protein [Myxococcota bacterium]HNH48316.1 TIGR02147 family protein [Myxococcota bacterium]
MPAPSIFDYLDQHRYFHDWYEWQKAHNPSFSHRSFTKKTGLSLGYLTNLHKGERVPEGEHLELLIRGMALSQEEGSFFRLLVRLARAGTWRERTEVLNEIFAHSSFEKADAIPARRLEYLSRWYYIAIRELEALPGFQRDPAWIAQQLRFPVSEADIALALEKLDRLRLIGETAPARLNTPAEVEGAAVVQYYRQAIALAIDALDRIPHQERHLMTTTLAVAPSQLPKIKAEIHRFITEITNLVDHPEEPVAESERLLVQLQVQMFPLSRASGGAKEG